MSYILDALNKSEQERREQQQVPTLQALHPSTPTENRTGLNLGLIIVATVLITCLLGAAVFFSLTDTADTPPAINTQSEAPERAIASSPSVATPMTASDSAPAAKRNPPPPRSKATDTAAVDSLYSAPLEPEAPTTITPQLRPEAAHQIKEAFSQTAVIRAISDLPASVQMRLPNMYYSAHIYSAEEGKGFAIINDQSRYKGDVLGPRLFVQEVREDGVVLNFEGQSFLLEALTDWPMQ